MAVNYQEVENLVYDWGVRTGIVANGKPMSQAVKCAGEAVEVIDALNQGSESETMLEIGDVWVTLVMLCATMDIKPIDCFEAAYLKIKDRKGFLRQDGTFIKAPS